MEDILIRKIKGGLLGMKQKTKEPKEVAKLLNKLKAINEGMYQDLLNDYKQVMKTIK
jgi:hypothetical protein